MAKEAFFTVEDIKISFNLFCCVLGIGKSARTRVKVRTLASNALLFLK
jgi:hypothetical protein